jgi:hypothetical protein
VAHLHPLFGFPNLVRFSWGTTKRLLEVEADAVPVQWCEHGSDDYAAACLLRCVDSTRQCVFVCVRREADAEDEEAVPGVARAGRLPFGGCPPHLQTSSGAGRHAYLRSRKLQRVTAF